MFATLFPILKLLFSFRFYVKAAKCVKDSFIPAYERHANKGRC